MAHTAFSECLHSWKFEKDPFAENYPFESLWALPRSNIDFLIYLLESTIGQKKPLDVLIQGDYGSGKTYMLKALQSHVETKLGGKGIYFNMPTGFSVKGFRGILEAIVRSIQIDTIRDIAKQECQTNGINEPAKLASFLASIPLNKDLSTVISNIAFDESYALSVAWLLGEATMYQTRALKLDSSPRDEAVAQGIIPELLDFLSLKYPIIAIFIDELEVLSGESASTRSIREGLRNLYDALIFQERKGSIAIFSAVTARAAYEIQARMGTALADRVDQNLILGPLDEKECEYFIKQLFLWARNGTDDSVSPPFKDSTALRDFIELLGSAEILPGLGPMKMRTPRKIVKAGKLLLMKTCFEGRGLIDRSFVQSVFREGQ